MHSPRRRRFLRASIALVAALALAGEFAAVTAQPARAAPTTRPDARRGKEPNPAAEAVTALVKEAREAIKEKKPVRTKSDYFANAETKPTEAQVVAELNKSASNNPLIDAYVKWQLLSAVPETFSQESAMKAIQALVNAPVPAAMPGTSPEVQQRLQKMLSRLRPQRDGTLGPDEQAQVDDLNRQLADEAARVADGNAMLLTYRDALIEKIPTADPKTKATLLKARIEDLWTRGEAGVNVAAPYRTVAADIQTWAALADGSAVEQMADFVREYARRTPKRVYERAEWNARRRQIDWKGPNAGLDVRKLAELETDLRQLARTK